jgi:hypothetical protein
VEGILAFINQSLATLGIAHSSLAQAQFERANLGQAQS